MQITLDAAAVGLLLTSLIHIAATIWWAATMTHRVRTLETQLVQLQQLPTALASLTATVGALRETLEGLEGRYDRHPRPT